MYYTNNYYNIAFKNLIDLEFLEHVQVRFESKKVRLVEERLPMPMSIELSLEHWIL